MRKPNIDRMRKRNREAQDAAWPRRWVIGMARNPDNERPMARGRIWQLAHLPDLFEFRYEPRWHPTAHHRLPTPTER